MEEYRKIAGTNYQVSSKGNIKNSKGHILKSKRTNTGYLAVCINGKWKYIHRLVAFAFIPNPDNKPCVNHIDSNRENNNIENLEWCTMSENIIHGYRFGNIKAAQGFLGKNGSRHPRSLRIIANINGIDKSYESINIASKELGIPRGNICRCLKGKCKQAKGITFNYM